ncbi:MAG TPA: NTP transferase domain-containing protein [Flavobacteriales bacterium]
MTSKDNHQKHGKVIRAKYGKFARAEFAVLGTTCDAVQSFYQELSAQLSGFKVTYIDADHATSDARFSSRMQVKSNGFELQLPQPVSEMEQRILLSQTDLAVVNGNHFDASSQIIICNPDKETSLRKRASQLTAVRAIVLHDGQNEVPTYVKELVPQHAELPVFHLRDRDALSSFIRREFLKPVPLNALILTGGKSTRMGKDKAQIAHHGVPQYQYLAEICKGLDLDTFISCREDQQEQYTASGQKVIVDALNNQGPLGGIISAFMHYPDCAWLVLASDIPLLDKDVLNELIAQRDASKNATAFISAHDGFPEPLIAIWEPKAYMRIMEFMAMGYDCPRKVLINTSTHLISPAEPHKLTNVNTPDELAKLQK